jgi:hypothetical protein
MPHYLGGVRLSVVDAHVPPARLLSGGDSELMAVGGQVAEAVERGR